MNIVARRIVAAVGATFVAAGAAGAGSATVAQAPLAVRVLDDASRQPLPNAEVIDLATGVRRFTNAQGEARVPWGSDGTLRLRVRQLGFQFVERTLSRATAGAAGGQRAERVAGDSVVVVLSRVAFVLPNAFTRAESRCADGADSLSRLLSVSVLEQLRMSAERYETFRRAYPFRVRQQRRTISFNTAGHRTNDRLRSEEADSEEWGERYQPRRIIHRTRLGFSVPILFISALADPAFWENHCFDVRGVETLDGERVLRLDFIPAPGVRGAEWAGAALVDSATSLLRRVSFHLAGLGDGDTPRRFEGYTTFRSPSPFIVVPDSTVAMWWRSRGPSEAGDWGMPDIAQIVAVESLRYRKARPVEAAPGGRR